MTKTWTEFIEEIEHRCFSTNLPDDECPGQAPTPEQVRALLGEGGVARSWNNHNPDHAALRGAQPVNTLERAIKRHRDLIDALHRQLDCLRWLAEFAGNLSDGWVMVNSSGGYEGAPRKFSISILCNAEAAALLRGRLAPHIREWKREVKFDPWGREPNTVYQGEAQETPFKSVRFVLTVPSLAPGCCVVEEKVTHPPSGEWIEIRKKIICGEESVSLSR